jgi:hypothetical protein
MEGMLETFACAVHAFDRAGVRAVCVKGFSLFPEYLEEPWQRHQIDFDFLIAPADAESAQAALESLGYSLAAVSRDGERRLRVPVKSVLGRDAYVYAPQQTAAIELHERFWETHDVGPSFHCAADAIDRAEMCVLGPVRFLRLARAHRFLYQLLHIFRHFLGSWARPLWLYEIAGYLNRHFGDDAHWADVRSLICADPRITDACALVLLMAEELFACPVPPALQDLRTLHDRSPVALWVRRYAHAWLLADMPGNKLNLLLHRHFAAANSRGRVSLIVRLAPFGQRPVLSEGLDPVVANSFAYRMANLRYQASRTWYHVRSGAGLAVASIPWAVSTRSRSQMFSAANLRREEL